MQLTSRSTGRMAHLARAERSEFLSVLSSVAGTLGLHVDAASDEELARKADVHPAFEKTLHAAVWKGEEDEELIASALDQPDHLGQVWLLFYKGEDSILNSRFRDSVMPEIMNLWPGTLALPIMPTGAIPHHKDLIKVPGGYIVDPKAAKKYGYPAE